MTSLFSQKCQKNILKDEEVCLRNCLLLDCDSNQVNVSFSNPEIAYLGTYCF